MRNQEHEIDPFKFEKIYAQAEKHEFEFGFPIEHMTMKERFSQLSRVGADIDAAMTDLYNRVPFNRMDFKDESERYEAFLDYTIALFSFFKIGLFIGASPEIIFELVEYHVKHNEAMGRNGFQI